MNQQPNNAAIPRRSRIIRGNPLTIQGRLFRDNYARLVSNNRSRVIKKDLIFKYHKLIRNINESILPMKRDEMRQISLYFSSRAPQRDLILQALQTLINNGTINYEQDTNRNLNGI